VRTCEIRGVGMTAFGRFPEQSVRELARTAVLAAVADAGVDLSQIETVFFANSLAGALDGQHCIRGEVLTYSMGMGDVSVVNVENACASGGTALHAAYQAVAGGFNETVLAIGVEKMYVNERRRVFEALWGALDVEEAVGISRDVTAKRSPFIDVYAERANRLIRDHGVTQEGLAAVAAKAWTNGARNDKAQRRTVMTPDEVLATPLLVSPLTIAMCSLIGDGAAAAVISAAPEHGRKERAVRIAASEVRALSPIPGDLSAAGAAAKAAFEKANWGPEDLSLAEVHDATAPGEMLSWVGLGLCQPGEEEKWAISGHTEIDGKLPVNVSGGLMARGHPIGASGLAQVWEAVTQLRGEAGERQLPNARRALTHVGGGVIHGNTAVAAVHLLEN
jgi:acetyl-CoA acyltransferase